MAKKTTAIGTDFIKGTIYEELTETISSIAFLLISGMGQVQKNCGLSSFYPSLFPGEEIEPMTLHIIGGHSVTKLHLCSQQYLSLSFVCLPSVS